MLVTVIRFNMEFRILEIKNAHMQPKYKPQYKNSGWFSSWQNISRLKFTDTIFCSVNFSDWDSNCVWLKSDAEKVIKELKEYLQSSEEYTVVHNCN